MPPTTEPTPIVVLAFNKHEETHRCLESIAKHTEVPFEIILVDNGSTPAFVPSSDYTLVSLPENLYYTRGINAGLRHVLSTCPGFESVVLLNNDTVVTPGWLTTLLQARTSDAGVIGNKHLLLEDQNEIIHAGTLDLIGGTHKGGSDHSLYTQTSNEVWVTFACVLITKRCLEAVGLLDERLAHYYSDNDFCLRASMAGFQVLCEPASTILHAHGLTYGESGISPDSDQQLYVDKWLGKDLIEKIFNRIFLDATARQLVTLERRVISKGSAQQSSA